jgi:alpha-methylacyl-CoA racemase
MLARNPKLVYGRVTGWGQTGPLALNAAHDINYIAITGALHAIGRADAPPVPPLNLVGNYGGGAMYLAFGLLAALRHADRTGEGQVVDVAISDCVANMMAWYHWFHQDGRWSLERESNISDGGAPFFGCYICADGRYISIGALEEPFYALLLNELDISDPAFKDRWNRAHWPQMRAIFAAIFVEQPRSYWEERLGKTDVCFAPVLRMDEMAKHPHNVERGVMLEMDGVLQPAPAPKLSRTPGHICHAPPAVGQDTQAILAELGDAR